MGDIYKIPEVYKKFKAKPNETLYEHTYELIKRLEQLERNIKVKYSELIKLACIYHDIGKANPLFANRLENKTKFDDNVEIGHNVLSAYLAYYILLEENLGDNELNTVAYAILNHHFYVNNFEVIEKKENLIDSNINEIIHGDIGTYLDIKEKYEKYKNKLRGKLAKLQSKSKKPEDKDILVKGFLHKCDYSASAGTEVEIVNDDLDDKLEKFRRNSNYKWNNMQNFAKTNTDKNIILIGSTGFGKTEASLLWIGNNKGFYVLPLRTAINAMYKRLKQDLYKNDYRQKLGLLHSNVKNIYLEQEPNKKDKDLKEEDKFWSYYEVTKNLVLPITITTPDQIFRFVFKYAGYELSLATYSYSKLIIDEIQAYSPELLAFLIYGIQRICKLGGKVAITTATFPPFIGNLLGKEYDEYKNEIDSGLDFIQKKFSNNTNRHRLELRHKNISHEDIVDFYIANKDSDSLKILIVMNTVKSAQNMYNKLQEELNEFPIDISLLHARFILRDRIKKEKSIISDGKNECKKQVIWIATQVVEASLDIDFDFLFTEFTELGSFFQRMGRCNRKGTKDISKANVFLYTEVELASLMKVGIVDKGLHELGKEALCDWEKNSKDTIISESDKESMMSNYYTLEKLNIKGSAYLDKYKETYQYISLLRPESVSIKEVQRHFRNIISFDVIPKLVYEKNKEDIDSIIEKIEEIYKTRAFDKKFELISLKSKIQEYIVSVGAYNGIKNEYSIKLGNDSIIISSGNYNEELGFSYPKYKGESQESIFI